MLDVIRSWPERSGRSVGLRLVALATILAAACTPAAPATPTSAPPAKPAEAPDSSQAQKAAPAATAGPAAQPTTAPAPAAGAPRRGGTLTVDTGSVKLQGLDPEAYQTTLEKNITVVIAENLLVRDKDLNLAPGLATTWTVADDGVTWTFELRKGLKFHDGTPFNAEAVKVTYERWTNPQTTNTTLRNVLAPILDGFEIVDDSTVRIKTKGKQAAFLALLSGWGVQIVSPTALKQHGKDLGIVTQVGTGPFKVESFVPGESLTLARNDDYWGQKPHLDKIVFKTIPDPSARTAALVTRQVDLSINVPPSQLASLKGEPTLQVIEQPVIAQQWVDMNSNLAPTDKVEVRQAINHAINMEEIGSVVYEGTLRPFQGPVPPEMFKPDPSIAGYTHDLNKARELLQQAGVSNAKLQFLYVESAVNNRFAEVLQEQLRRVGIELELARHEAATIENVTREGKYHLRTTGLSNSSGDPWTLFGSELRSAARNNHGKHSHPKFDPLIEQIGTEIDPTKRAALLNEFYRAYFEWAPWVATANPILPYVMSKRVQGFVGHPVGDLYSWTGLWLSE